MSPHVVPKARAASSSFEEEEKTTIESGWEEEPSTTVEQSEVAERIRAMANDPRRHITNVTSTGVLEEPTVDDQRANAALSMITPAALKTRLLVTTGNDTGQDLAIEPGRTYTIGRAIDNDLVLTDIAVSRKHFDLRHDNGCWVVVDRGSGNGTLVNGAVEDRPFVLANGDTIEIGNTVFRFEQPNGTPRPVQTYDASLDVSMDSMEEEEEPSTVAGKPIRDEPVAPQHVPAMNPRPKTVPPPAPLRARSTSQAPPPSYPQYAQPIQPQPLHAQPILPGMSAAMTHQLAQQPPGGQVPRGAPAAPTMLAGLAAPGQPMPTTIPGQGAPRHGGPSSIPPGGYQPYLTNQPNAPQHLQQHSQPHLAHAHAQSQPHLHINGTVPRDATSTALVGGYGMPMQVAQPYRARGLSRRVKMILGATGLTLLAAIATVAIIKGTSGEQPASSAAPDEPEQPDKLSDALRGSGSAQVSVQPIDPPKTDPPKTDPPKTDPPKTDPPKTDPPKTAIVTPPKTDPPKTAIVTPPKIDPPKKDPPKRIVKKDPPKRTPKKEPKKEPKRVAVADTGGVRAKADALYRAKDFSGAAQTLKRAASNFGPDEATDLRSLAGTYSQFAKAYNVGMAPGTPAKDAWKALFRARTYDNNAGNAFGGEISARLGQIAPKAAVLFMVGKDYASVKKAIGMAESTGNRNKTTDGLRSKLELEAGKLVRQAQAELDKDPSGARQKLKLVQRMVDPNSPWHQRAGKLLSGKS